MAKMMKLLVMTVVLVIASSSELEDFFPPEDIFPSDAPITMMERLTDERGSSQGEDVELVTPLGVITGRKEPSLGETLTNAHHYSFRGIPFAKAPVGELRFADPVDKKGPWSEGRLDATKFRPFCPQFDNESKRVLGKEDCLYLNVYTPVLPGSGQNKTEQLPVLVFFHGGAYLRGSSSAHGPARLLAHDIVLVTTNYRLGALGFLSTGDETLPGNYGMLDQVSALRWVQDNVGYFGGNASRVTIGGFSAGAASVHLHMVSPLSQGLFHGGIMMSGSAICPWVVRNSHSFARQLSTNLGCTNTSSYAIKTCLSNITMETLLIGQAGIHKFGFWPLPFVPTIDGGVRSHPFLPHPVNELPPARVPVLLGALPHEGLLFAAGVVLLSEKPHLANAVYKEAVPYFFSTWPEDDLPLLKEVMENYYFTHHATSSLDVLVEQMTEALTDYSFHHCVWDDAKSLAKSGMDVYTYLYTHRDPDTPTWATPLYDKLRSLGVTTPLMETGLSHGDDMVMLFDFPYALGKFSARDKRVSTLVTAAWTNFVTNGSPHCGAGVDLSWANLDSWTPLEPGKPMVYYDINTEPSVVHSQPRQKERNLWKQVMQRVSTRPVSQPQDSCLAPHKTNILSNSSL